MKFANVKNSLIGGGTGGMVLNQTYSGHSIQ